MLVNHDDVVYIETYGCQMNASDTEIVLSILKSANISQINDYKNVIDKIFSDGYCRLILFC